MGKIKSGLAKLVKNRWVILIGGILLGALVILGIRFATYKVDAVHYHANFGVYINGQQELFSGPAYYEEETACKVGKNITPADRAHMHDKINNVVHVHDRAVTWEQFFNNLGWSIGPDFIQTKVALYQNSGDSQLHIILNGQNLTGLGSIANRVIGDRDKLLISFGDVSNSALQSEYKAIPSTAIEHDEENDPATCSGPSVTTFHDRFTHLF